MGLDEPESLYSDGKHKYNNLKVINFKRMDKEWQ